MAVSGWDQARITGTQSRKSAPAQEALQSIDMARDGSFKAELLAEGGKDKGVPWLRPEIGWVSSISTSCPMPCCLLLQPLCCEPWFCHLLGLLTWQPVSLLPDLPSAGIDCCLLPLTRASLSLVLPPRPPGLRYFFIFSPNPEERRWKECFNWKLLDVCMIKNACKPLSMAKIPLP